MVAGSRCGSRLSLFVVAFLLAAVSIRAESVPDVDSDVVGVEVGSSGVVVDGGAEVTLSDDDQRRKGQVADVSAVESVSEVQPETQSEAQPKTQSETQTESSSKAEPKKSTPRKRRRKRREEQRTKRDEEEAAKQAEKEAAAAAAAAEAKAKAEAEAKAKAEAEAKAKAEAEAKAEAAKEAKRQADNKAKKEAEQKAKQDAEQKAKRKAEQKAKQEAEQKAKQKAKRKAEQKAKAKATTNEKTPPHTGKTGRIPETPWWIKVRDRAAETYRTRVVPAATRVSESVGPAARRAAATSYEYGTAAAATAYENSAIVLSKLGKGIRAANAWTAETASRTAQASRDLAQKTDKSLRQLVTRTRNGVIRAAERSVGPYVDIAEATLERGAAASLNVKPRVVKKWLKTNNTALSAIALALLYIVLRGVLMPTGVPSFVLLLIVALAARVGATYTLGVAYYTLSLCLGSPLAVSVLVVLRVFAPILFFAAGYVWDVCCGRARCGLLVEWRRARIMAKPIGQVTLSELAGAAGVSSGDIIDAVGRLAKRPAAEERKAAGDRRASEADDEAFKKILQEADRVADPSFGNAKPKGGRRKGAKKGKSGTGSV